MSRKRQPKAHLVLPIPYDQVSHSDMPESERIVDGDAPIRFLGDEEGFLRFQRKMGVVVWGFFGLVFTCYMCGWGVIPGVIWGWYFGDFAGRSLYANLLDRIHREHAEQLEAAAGAGLAAAKAQAKEAQLAAKAERERLRAASQDPVFTGLLGLGYSREEALRGLRATLGEQDTAQRLLGALAALRPAAT